VWALRARAAALRKTAAQPPRQTFKSHFGESRFCLATPKKVVPFVKKRKLTSTVVLFDGGDPNQWIDRVEPRWRGSIPATLFLYKGKRIFYEGQLSEPELYQYIQKIKKQTP
jgi:hypothetical protein